MADLEIKPGTFVWYPAKGLGRVQWVGAGSVKVLFWADGKSGNPQTLPLLALKPLPGDTKAKYGDASGFTEWAKNAPLTLAAVALADCGGGTERIIKETLKGRALSPSGLGSWWKRVQPKLISLPKYFRVTDTTDGPEYALLPGIAVADVPLDFVKPKPPTVADWKRWLTSATHDAPPGRFPPKTVSDGLARWPARTIEPVLLRVITSAEEFLTSGGDSGQTAEGWLRAVAQASLRWGETVDADSRGYRAARVGRLLARLASIAGDRTPRNLLLQAGALDGATHSWRQGFAAGMWETFDGNGARDMYEKLAPALNRQAQADLAREIAASAFGPTHTARRYPALDRLLDALPESERHQLVIEMITRASSDTKADILAYVTNSRHAAKSADANKRLEVLLLATLRLSNRRGEIPAQASQELDNVLAAPDSSSPALQSLFRQTRSRIDEERANAADERESERRAHAEAMERERAERKRLHGLLSKSNKELEANRKQSRLEVRQDMLLAVGEVLQTVVRRQASSIDELAGNVEAGLTLALKAGEAELLNTAPEGKVVAPGVQVRGIIRDKNKEDGFKEVVKVLLKPQVKQEVG